MSQKEVAQRLGIAEATLSRWLHETQIQSRSMDNLLRVFFALPQVRRMLRGESRKLQVASPDDCRGLTLTSSRTAACLKPARQPGMPSFCTTEPVVCTN
jgi:transcriptional regulator with XRE-family HTH domain